MYVGPAASTQLLTFFEKGYIEMAHVKHQETDDSCNRVEAKMSYVVVIDESKLLYRDDQ